MRPAVEEARAAAARSTLCRIGAVRRAGALGWGGGDAGPWAEALRVAPEDPSPRLLQRPPAASGSPAQLRRRDRPGPVDPPEPAARPPPTAVRPSGTPRPTGPAGRRAGGPRHRRRASGRPPGRPGQRTPMAARCPPFWRTPPELVLLFGGSRLPLAGSNENRRLIRAEGEARSERWLLHDAGCLEMEGRLIGPISHARPP